MAGFSSRGIFLSYRREDTAPYARLLQFQLRERFPDARVFLDLDSIEVGLDFAEVIREAVESCTVLVALIGRQWATLADEEGHRIMGACPPEQTMTLQLIHSFVRYARAHGGELQGNAVVAVFRALREAYPCRAKHGD